MNKCSLCCSSIKSETIPSQVLVGDQRLSSCRRDSLCPTLMTLTSTSRRTHGLGTKLRGSKSWTTVRKMSQETGNPLLQQVNKTNASVNPLPLKALAMNLMSLR